MQNITILAIESSCDDTAAAILRNGKVLANIVSSQLDHEKYGGVIPELASRLHQQNIVRVVQAALQKAEISKEELNAVAFTQGPGLIGALLVGISFAKAFALGLNIPLITVHHMQAHILANFLSETPPKFPFLCLTVSGGHTQLVLVKDFMEMEILGQTIDDAVGEAFDKGAKMLGLPYPGGPMVDKWAKQGNSQAFRFPDAETNTFDFSFSGIKTSLLYLIQKNIKENPHFIQENMADLCASYQAQLIKMLLSRLKKAAKYTKVSDIAIAGGVSANSELRTRLVALCEENGWQAHIPAFEFCTDNAAMIGIAGHYKYLAGDFADMMAVPFTR